MNKSKVGQKNIEMKQTELPWLPTNAYWMTEKQLIWLRI